jgi:AcrR family transcriptional regulator
MVSNRREQERQHRRELLLEAASRVFGRKPFDEATIQEVAAEAEIGMQGLYEHFPSKQELYEAVMIKRAQAFHQRAEEALAQPGTPLQRLRALALAFVQGFQERPMVLPMFVRDRTLFDWGLDSRFAPKLRQHYLDERRHLLTLLEAAIAEGEIQDQDPEFLAQVALDILQASLRAMHRSGRKESAEACVDRALACLLHGIGGRP